ncbi:tetraspanin-19 [Amborella trichopoda]|nr:tetraspanin-19 [Amborella trichopoda]|eukprot:XP_006827788.2 tetraspanin-19 [Amborella trichopoda]
MGRMVRSCLQSLLKLVNSIIGMVGIAMILYSLWMLRIWHQNLVHSSSYGIPETHAPWFMYTFLGLGITLCFITCTGYIAVETINGHCLSCYMVFVFLLFLFEAGIIADIFINKDWEEDFPEDPTGKFNEFKNFVRTNFEMCKWVGLVVLVAQALSIFLAMILRAVGPHPRRDYDSDDDYTPARLPLLKNHAPQPQFGVEPHMAPMIDPWSSRSH